ncbi:coiled-coil domain-containing protein 130-like protein, partial [Tanacetum coccineum]
AANSEVGSASFVLVALFCCLELLQVAATKSHVILLGTGELMDEFESFDVKSFVSHLLGKRVLFFSFKYWLLQLDMDGHIYGFVGRFKDLYTEPKAQAEAYVLLANDIDGLLTCVIRPSNVFGPGDKVLLPSLIEVAKFGWEKGGLKGIEMPYNIWCGGCHSMISKIVRFNVENKQVGNYYSTKNCEYLVISRAQKKYEDFDNEDTETMALPVEEGEHTIHCYSMLGLRHLLLAQVHFVNSLAAAGEANLKGGLVLMKL